jgi:hypothetical protein
MKTSRKYSQCQMNSQNEVNRRMHGERPSDCRRRFRGKNPRSRTIRRRTQGRGTTGRSSEDMVPTVAAWVLMCNGVRCTWVYVDTHTRSARWQPKGLAHQYSCVCVSTVVMWDLLGPTSVSSMCVNTRMIPPHASRGLRRCIANPLVSATRIVCVCVCQQLPCSHPGWEHHAGSPWATRIRPVDVR